MEESRKKIPSLDGLRAVSILLVLVDHCLLFAPKDIASEYMLALGANGMFFVISGFLITLLMLRERERSGRIDLGSFYIRRVFRLLPALFVYLATLCLLTHFGFVSFTLRDLLQPLTFTTNYHRHLNLLVSHTWSLSVEEQFYLVWPLLVVAFPRKALIWIASAVIVLEPLIRALTYYAFPAWRIRIRFMGHTRADILMFGCLAALFYGSVHLQRLLRLATRLRLPAFGILFLLFLSPVLALWGHGLYLFTIGYTLQAFFITLVMLYAMQKTHGPLGKLLNGRVLTYIGSISYSLYLWQQLFLVGHYPVWRLALGVPCAFALAELSSRFIEQPMIRLRRRLESPSRPPLPGPGNASAGRGSDAGPRLSFKRAQKLAPLHLRSSPADAEHEQG